MKLKEQDESVTMKKLNSIKYQVIAYVKRIELLPVRDIREMRGFLKGIDTTVEREVDRL
jgi:hypothetical protein